jgi:hypothetical protein
MDLEDFENYSDFDLCDQVFSSFPGNKIDVESYDEVERVITLVWHSLGIIGNGGFYFLFEGEFNGDPGYMKTREAYKIIGATSALKAFDEAFSKFSGNELSGSIKKRIEKYGALSEDERRRIDKLFWDSRSEIETQLAEYIRKNKEAVLPIISVGS